MIKYSNILTYETIDIQFKHYKEPGMLVHNFNPSTGKLRKPDLCEFEFTLVYGASSSKTWITKSILYLK